MSVEILSQLIGPSVPTNTVRSWTELVAMIPHPMLRPAEPPSSHWHRFLARYCLSVENEYSLRWRVEHCLQGGMAVEAAAALSDFDYLYRRIRLGPEQAARIWHETRLARDLQPQTLLGKELALWEQFWRGRQFLLDEVRPQLTFLSLADGYAQGSPISQAAEQWLEREGPEHPWLRHRFRPAQPYHAPLLLEVPASDLAARHSDWVDSLHLSPDGIYAITGMFRGAIRVWDVASGQSLGLLQETGSGSQALAFSGHRLAVANQAGVHLFDLPGLALLKRAALFSSCTPLIALAGNRLFMRGNFESSTSIQVWDLEPEQPRQLAWLPGPKQGLQQLATTPDGRRLTARWDDGRVTGWDLDEQGKMTTFHPDHRRPWGQQWADGRVVVTRGSRRRLELSGGRGLLSSNVDDVDEWCEGGAWGILQVRGSWHCWNLDEASCLASWGPPRPEGKLVLNPKGDMLVQAGFAGAPPLAQLGPPQQVRVDAHQRRALTWDQCTLHVFNLETGHEEAHLRGHEQPIVQAALSRDGRRGVSVSADHTIRVWELPGGKCLRTLRCDATAIGVNCDGTRAVSGSQDGKLRIWDLSEGTCRALLEGHDEAVRWAVWTDQDWLISGDQQCFRIWDASHSFRSVLERPAPAHFIELSPCGRFAYCERFGPGVRGRPTVRDLDKGHSLSYLDRRSSKPAASVFTPDGGRLVVATQEGQYFQSVAVRLWDVVSPSPAGRFRLPRPDNAMATDGRLLLGSCQDHKVRLWDLNSPAPPGHDASLLCMHLEGRRLATGSIDKTARVWDLDSGSCLHVLGQSDRWISQVRLCGDYLQTISDEGSFLWDLPRQLRQTTDLFPSRVGQGGLALTRIDECNLKVWDPRGHDTGVCLGPQEPQLTACAFSPDETRAATGGSTGNLKIWDAVQGTLLASWDTPVGCIRDIRWVADDLLLLQGDGRQWTWDLVSGTGTRDSQEREGDARYTLDFGTTYKPAPLRVLEGRSGQCVAHWPQPCEEAMFTAEHEIVAALSGGELAFFQMMPAGRLVSESERPQSKVETPSPPAQPGTMHLTPLHRLAPCQRILLVGSGGRSDMLAAVPLYEALRAQGKEVFLAGLISGRKTSTQKRFVEVAPSQRKGARFEQLLAAHLEAPVLCFPAGGTLNRLETFRDLLRHSGAEALVLVEAGMETLLRGDEPSLGTAADDLVSLAAAHQLELPLKMLVNLGMGIDRPKGVSLAYTLEAIAELTQSGGFWGSLTLLPGMPEFQSLAQAAEKLAAATWSEALLAATTGRCGGDPYVSPLLSLMWFFDLDAVARRSLLIEWLADKLTPLDVHRAITNFLTVTPAREWIDLPI
jgi:WD40 repeat protein